MGTRYVLAQRIGAGGMASVYLGYHGGDGTTAPIVAIKSLHAHLASDPRFVAMFLDEARLASRVQHPNVVRTIDIGLERGDMVLVM